MNIFKYIKEWWEEGDIHINFEKKQKELFDNHVFFDEKIIQNDIKKKCNAGKSTRFFDKIAWLKLKNERKNEIAQKIVDDSFPSKLYRIQLFLSCIIVALGLFMNSIPVIIGAMLISPLLDPIKTFAFAITNGHKNMYFRSVKTIFLSILVAIISSIFVSFIVPFSHITSEIMARVSPTMIDLFVALFSGAVAFLSLGFKKLQENIAGVAIAVALLPPLSVVGIGIFFLDLSIAQGSFLLFLTNLVAILIVGVIVFYLFGFFPTNKIGQKRSFTIFLMVVFSVLFISIPLHKSMSQISDNIKFTSQIKNTSKDYLSSIDDKIFLDKINFNTVLDDLVRVSAVLSVPSDVLLTDEHKTELTKILSIETNKSIELDLSIIERSSVYVVDQKTDEDILISKINNILLDNFHSVFVLDYKLLDQEKVFLFLNLYTDKKINQEDIYDLILLELKDFYGDDSNLVIQWQTNGMVKKDKTQQEIEIERQFDVLFSGSSLDNIEIQNLSKSISGENQEYILLDIKFVTYDNSVKIKSRLRDWKIILEQYLGIEVVINSKIQYISLFEI